MEIKLKCACGAIAEFKGDTYINNGTPDTLGRKFLVQVDADSWRQEHQGHAEIYCFPRMMED